MSFSLPEYSPRWARWLGLTIDWQSRPSDQSRTYHNDDRTVELVVGRRYGSSWALQMSRYSEYTSLHIAVPGVSIHWRIAPGEEPPVGEMAVSWGAYIYDDGAVRAPDLVLEWGGWSKRIALNPFRFDSYESWRLRADGEWDGTKMWKPQAKEIEWYCEEHPYAVASRAHLVGYRDDESMPIEVFSATARCYIERSERRRRWLPFWPRVEHHVYFDLSDEVGPGKGSWKGGTLGFSEPMLPGDSVTDVVDRAASKSRGQ